MLAIARGQMGWSLEDTLNSTPFEFYSAQEKFFEKIKSDREWEFNTRIQVARWQVFRTLCPPDKKQISVLDLITLPGDEELIKEAKKRESDESKYERAKQRFGKFEA